LELRVVIGIVALLMALISGGVFLYFMLGKRDRVDMRSLMSRAPSSPQGLSGAARAAMDPEELEAERIKQSTSSKFAIGRSKISLEERFFQAGIFSDADKLEFNRLRILIPCVTVPVLGVLAGYVAGASMALVGAVLGLLLGLQAPISLLDRRKKARAEDIMFYLPLVIEQIAIGVSSSLDVGPCIQRVVSMADERDSHNVVTELLRTAQFYIKSGVSLEEALTEVGRLAGQNELKHAFMSLSQVAKHGGEITRQLQELADAVGSQRETKIDAKIKKLELEATAPVALVFCGFLIILLIGFGTQIMKAF